MFYSGNSEKNPRKEDTDRSSERSQQRGMPNVPEKNGLSLRKPENVGKHRVYIKQSTIDSHFDLLKETVENLQLTPDRIYNMDETGWNKQQQQVIFSIKNITINLSRAHLIFILQHFLAGRLISFIKSTHLYD